MTPTIILTSLVVPPLTDNDFWFRNAADWSNYWLQAGFQATIPVADTVTYGVVKAATTLTYVPVAPLTPTNRVTINMDGVDYAFVIADDFDNLLLRFNNLEALFEDLRTALKAAGHINNAQ